MSGRFNCSPSVVPPLAVADDRVIDGGWYPSIDPVRLRRELRLDTDAVTAERLRHAILGAMLTVQGDLGLWAAGHRGAGYASLADVPTPLLDGESRLVILYQRAIGAFVKAELTEGQRDFDLTGAGGRRADTVEPSIGDLRRDGLHAIRDMLDRTRTAVELI